MATLKSLLVKSVTWLLTWFLLLAPCPHYLQAILTCLFAHLDILDMILLKLLAQVNPFWGLCELVNFIYLFIYLMTGWIIVLKSVPHPTSTVWILCGHFQSCCANIGFGRALFEWFLSWPHSAVWWVFEIYCDSSPLSLSTACSCKLLSL